MGNPHYVIFVNEFAPNWQAEAAEIGRPHNFKHGINVELVKALDKGNIDVRFFERGVGETQSSGTGSCAAAVAAIVTKRAESPAPRAYARGSANGTLGGASFSSRNGPTNLQWRVLRLTPTRMGGRLLRPGLRVKGSRVTEVTN